MAMFMHKCVHGGNVFMETMSVHAFLWVYVHVHLKTDVHL